MYHRSGHVFQCPYLKQIMIYVAPVLDQSGFKFLLYTELILMHDQNECTRVLTGLQLW